VINTRAKKCISTRYLSEDERVAIADLRRAKLGVREIARELVRSPSTISRELRRNRDSRGQYRPFTAHRMAAERRARPGRGKIIRDAVLRAVVVRLLGQRLSPEQVAHALRGEFPTEPARHLATETVYQAVYRPELGGLAREWPRVLRSRRYRRRPRPHPQARRRGVLTGMTMIDERPAEAADRSVPGHWEGDLITGAENRSAIVTVVERASRFTLLGHLPEGRHTAEAVRDVLIGAFAGFPAHLRGSLTWDQGKEMALHRDVTIALGMPVYFCEKASPWQRPSNENTNGLLRHYFPKGSDLRVYGPDELAAVAAELNARPRKTMAWDTPTDRFTHALSSR
jgi:IS30 family transposase